MTASPDELAFIARFQPLLRKTREDMGFSQPQMAASLGLSLSAYKKLEWRSSSAFPLYLLPQLIRITGRPVEYWLGPDLRPRGFRPQVVHTTPAPLSRTR